MTRTPTRKEDEALYAAGYRWGYNGYLAEQIAERTPREWREWAKEITDAGEVPGWMAMATPWLMFHASDPSFPAEAIPAETAGEMDLEMFEAAREAAIGTLTDFCRRLQPAVEAIEEFCRP